jgi:hypothetical protein
VATAVLELLDEGLRPFITGAVRAALGDDLFAYYLPPDGADVAALLRYVRSKWLAVFSDTPLEPHAAAIERLADVALDLRRACNKLPDPVAADAARDVEAVLLAIRKPALAAKVAQVSQVTHKCFDESGAADGSIVASSSPASASAPSSRLAVGSPLLSAHLHNAQDRIQTTVRPDDVQTLSAQNVPVALDGSNIAWRHGASKRFSIRGVVEALAYFAQRGHPSVVFLPEARMRVPPLPAAHAPDGEAEAFAALQTLEGGPQLVLTPEKDYDDCYLTHFARSYQAVIVSNDAFADQVYQAEAQGTAAANEWRRWLSACRLSFTFHGHAFVPNPAFSFERARKVAQELCNLPPVDHT